MSEKSTATPLNSGVSLVTGSMRSNITHIIN